MYTTLYTTATLALARQHEADVKASFPGEAVEALTGCETLRKHHSFLARQSTSAPCRSACCASRSGGSGSE